MSDPIDVIKPWSIKACATRTQAIATAAARRENLTVGQWLEKRIDEWEGQGSPERVTTRSVLSAPELAAVLQSMAAVATATGIVPPKASVRRAYALIDDHVRQTRGLPGRKPGKPVPNGATLAAPEASGAA